MATDISTFEGRRVLVVGDLMIDEYVWGDVDRISPEAPVQIVNVEREEYTLGGAGNVVNNLAALGADVAVAGVIGTLADGDRMLAMFSRLSADTGGVIREPQRPTTRKTRIIASGQHVLRIDRETRQDISGATFDRLNRFIAEKMPETDVVLLSDYGKGLITPPFIEKLLETAENYGKQVIADPKGLDFTKYAGVSLLTPNRKEASLASGIEIRDRETLCRAGEKLLATTGIRNLLLTCGKDGMVLFERGKSPKTIRAEARQVYDVSGAGDTVISVFGLAVASGLAFAESAAVANTAAGIVVGKVGTATVTRQELAAALRRFPDEMSSKYKSLTEISEIVRDLKKKGRKVVLTNGCFDLLHAGHIMLFSASRQMGDALIVAIDDDASVKKIKGHGRPVIAAQERVRILSALDSVDYVVVFSTEALDQLIEIIRPDVLTKGSNYAAEAVEGHALVERLGGRVALIPVTGGTSSSDMINHIKNAGEEL
ncbi:bifunctional heptose 7-phosphate kinase/heptose 1-phosphate adenyltransferase [Desulfonema ishimotonii]|uniref:Bifunctional protein HldE n=1 Tax=Desulfonema ishimotonii TaxID=45657 RepID=A0A401G0W4_9BACT|nr:D-glycero-beta-D-manno-heptose-7-phosphate kinase [Desulfonema ishimotonii]GBC62823.1 bifunctional heptose 7-phosphate kinase/heptose 1-phosphate adenyltransferase [Desulfonema ishimotonii]